MRCFRDTQNNTWEIAITLGAAMEVRDKLGIDILQPELGSPSLIDRIANDEISLGEILLVLLQSQFDKKKLPANEVPKLFDGVTLKRALDAFYEELADFFQSRGRPDRAAAITKQQALVNAAIEVIRARAEAVDLDKAKQEMEERSNAIYGDSFGKSAGD